MNEGKWMAVGGVMTLVGIAAGAYLFGAPPAAAQHSGFRQCFGGQQEVVDINSSGDVTMPSPAYTVNVPAGWTVVSGAGGGRPDHMYILFCR